MCEMLSEWRRYLRVKVRLITVEPVLFLYMLIVFMEMNTLQSLIYTKVCLNELMPQNLSVCSQKLNTTDGRLQHIEHEAVVWNQYYSACLNFCTFLMSFYVASWSDCLSPKVVMLIPPVGTSFASLVNLILSSYIEAHVAYFFISGIVSGLTFGTVGIIASSFGYLTEIVSEDSRTKRIFILEMMIFIGGTVGYSLSGVILKNTDLYGFFNDYAKVFTLEFILAGTVVLYVVWRIPYYSMNEDVALLRADQDITFSGLFSLNHVKQSIQTVFKARSNDNRKKVLLLMFSYIILSFGLSVQLTLSFLYMKNEPLSWTSTEYSSYSAAQFGIEGLALLLGLPVAFHILKVSDSVTAALGFLSRAAGLVLLGLSTTKTMVFSCCGLFIFSEYASPSIRSMLSKVVGPDEKGKIFAFTTILQNLCYFSGSFMFSSIFNASLPFFPGLCFEIVAGLQVIGVIIMGYLYFSSNEFVAVYEIMENGDGSIDESYTTRPVTKEMQYPTA